MYVVKKQRLIGYEVWNSWYCYKQQRHKYRCSSLCRSHSESSYAVQENSAPPLIKPQVRLLLGIKKKRENIILHDHLLSPVVLINHRVDSLRI